MNLLQRHIFKSVLFSCAAAVGLFAFVLMVGNAVKDLLGYVVAGQLKPEVFAELVLLLVPFVVSYALPIGVLTGVLLVLGRMSAEHEVTAMRAAGLSLPWIARPILLLAALGVLAGVAVNFQFMPWARVMYHVELGNAVRTNPLSFIVPRTFIRDFPGKVLYVGEKQGQTMQDFWLWELDRQGRVKNFIRAESGSFDFDETRGELILNLAHAQAETRDQKNPEDFSAPPPSMSFERTSVRLSLERLFGKNAFQRKLQWYTYPDLLAEWRRLEQPAPPAARRQRALDRMKLQMVVQDKFTTAFAVFSFALIGVPLGIKVSRRETSANLGLALALAMGYYFLTIVVGWFDKHPELRPDLLLWAPNLIFLGIGLWLFRRMDRR
ncbi:MAG: LptF/LptG family permease [Opitutaceae bacterium]|nr:LptF/LptG family permease [Opitutaceae bacterium]